MLTLEESKMILLDWTLRIAMFGIFLGHGVLAIGPAFLGLAGPKKDFSDVATNFVLTKGMLTASAVTTLLLWIGILSIIVAIVILFKPIRVLLIIGALWAFFSALARPFAGQSFFEFVVRFGNFGVPLALLWIRGWPKTAKEWFS